MQLSMIQKGTIYLVIISQNMAVYHFPHTTKLLTNNKTFPSEIRARIVSELLLRGIREL